MFRRSVILVVIPPCKSTVLHCEYSHRIGYLEPHPSVCERLNAQLIPLTDTVEDGTIFIHEPGEVGFSHTSYWNADRLI